MFAYLDEGVSDFGLETLLRQFQTLFPYLRLIARANSIKDPFDSRVVEAYWVGNELLENVSKQKLYENLVDDHRLKKKLGSASFSAIGERIGKGALPHHSFHVLNIWKRTGHLEREHTLESMNECRVSWGRVASVAGPYLDVETQALAMSDGKLGLHDSIKRRIVRHLEASSDIGELKTGDVISIHWGVPCEVLLPQEVNFLRRYTLHSIRLANGEHPRRALA